jgi:hypothetical protein
VLKWGICYLLYRHQVTLLHRGFSYRDSYGKPGERRKPKAKGFQPLKGLNAKAAKDTKKVKHRAEAPVKKG